ncbi:MAG: histidine kinase dimerization/phospho-acceptor domain-containing protein, partial [Thermodesulfobacteriota bacterium]
MNSKTQKNLRRAKTHQKIDALHGDVTGVSPDPKLTREEGAQVTEAIMPRKTLEAEITDPLELGKVPKEDQEKFRLLLNYIHDLLGIIRRLEDQLQRSSNVGIVGKTMVAGLAHDLRNPMAVIGSCAQFCLENEKLTPVTEKYLQMIQGNGKAAINLLNQFL